MKGSTIKFGVIALTMILLCGWSAASAQHTLGITGGYGMSTSRLQPTQEMRSMWGRYHGGLSWRYYGTQRYVGGFGLDLEFMQQGFAFAPYASTTEKEEDYKYYTRKFNSVMLPIVWEPHIYIREHVRVFLNAMATFSYNFDSTYDNEIVGVGGKYNFRLPRDNRWGYGLGGGAGIAVLVGRVEVMVRARYYFGFSDIVRNRNRYVNNQSDGPENPFFDTPLRSPTDNITISIGVAYRFNKSGFTVWEAKREKRERMKKTFNYIAK